MLTARGDAGRRHDELYPAYRVPLEMEELRPERGGGARRRRAGGLPAQGRGPGGRVALRERGLEGRRPLGGLPARPREPTSAGTSRTRRPSCSTERSTGCPRPTARRSAAPSWWPRPGCNSTAALLALLPLAGRIDDAVVDIKAGVSGAGREATEETHYVSAVDNVNPYKTEGHRHVAELEQELPGVRFASCPTCCRSTRGSSRAATSNAHRGAHEGGGARALRAAPTPTSPSWRWSTSRRARATCASRTARTVYVTVVDGRVLSFCAIDNLWKGAAGQAVQDLNLMLGLPETEGLE